MAPEGIDYLHKLFFGKRKVRKHYLLLRPIAIKFTGKKFFLPCLLALALYA
jgi:hypothetical protein